MAPPAQLTACSRQYPFPCAERQYLSTHRQASGGSDRVPVATGIHSQRNALHAVGKILPPRLQCIAAGGLDGSAVRHPFADSSRPLPGSASMRGQVSRHCPSFGNQAQTACEWNSASYAFPWAACDVEPNGQHGSAPAHSRPSLPAGQLPRVLPLNHASKPMLPRRAPASGTRLASSSSAPKYRARSSSSTTIGSLVAAR